MSERIRGSYDDALYKSTYTLYNEVQRRCCRCAGVGMSVNLDERWRCHVRASTWPLISQYSSSHLSGSRLLVPRSLHYLPRQNMDITRLNEFIFVVFMRSSRDNVGEGAVFSGCPYAVFVRSSVRPDRIPRYFLWYGRIPRYLMNVLSSLDETNRNRIYYSSTCFGWG